jgi:hypothetical protein
MAASLVSTLVNYSISIGLGLAGTIESRLNHGGRDLLRGFRSAWHMGIGLASLGIMVALSLIASTHLRRENLRSKV